MNPGNSYRIATFEEYLDDTFAGWEAEAAEPVCEALDDVVFDAEAPIAGGGDDQGAGDG